MDSDRYKPIETIVWRHSYVIVAAKGVAVASVSDDANTEYLLKTVKTDWKVVVFMHGSPVQCNILHTP